MLPIVPGRYRLSSQVLAPAPPGRLSRSPEQCPSTTEQNCYPTLSTTSLNEIAGAEFVITFDSHVVKRVVNVTKSGLAANFTWHSMKVLVCSRLH